MRVNIRYINSTRGTFENVPLVEFMYFVGCTSGGDYAACISTHATGESYRRYLLRYLCDVFPVLINSLACCFVWLVGVFTVCIFWAVFIAANA